MQGRQSMGGGGNSPTLKKYIKRAHTYCDFIVKFFFVFSTKKWSNNHVFPHFKKQLTCMVVIILAETSNKQENNNHLHRMDKYVSINPF